MKNIIIILLALLSFTPNKAKAQIDSAQIKINTSIQVRDAEYLGSFISFKEEYEDLFDAIKSKLRIPNAPTNTTLITVDSVTVGVWYKVMNHIRKDHIAIQGGIFTRLDAIVRAKNNAYLNRLLNEANAFDTRQYQDSRLFGRIKLRRQP